MYFVHLRYHRDAADLLDPGVVGRRHPVEIPRDLRPEVGHRDELRRGGVGGDRVGIGRHGARGRGALS